MPAPVVVTGVTSTVTIVDADGNAFGSAENPLHVESAELRAGLADIVEELKDFKETVKLITQ